MREEFKITRRAFGKKSLAGLAASSLFPALIPASALGKNGTVAPSERVLLGTIGTGNRCKDLIQGVFQTQGAQIVAVCDVKRDCRENAAKMINDFYGTTDCAMYSAHEELLARKDIDACLVASTDHWHALHALAATRAGKAVYVEKPLSVSMEQNRALRAAVRECKTVLQFGTQQRSDEKFWRACELARNGRVGKLKTIRVWAPPSSAGGPTQQGTPPETLDYERWLGPAPYTPYTLERETNKWWWFISDYALGFIAGWGIHPMDIAYWGAGDLMRTKVSVSGKGTFPTEGVCNTATQWNVKLRYESGLTVHFTSDPPPAKWKKRYGEITGHGTVFEGSDGFVRVDRSHLTASSPAILAEKIGDNETRLYRSKHHMRNFVECIREKKDPVSPIEDAVAGDAISHMSDIAIRLGRTLHWDPKEERFKNDDEANARLTRTIRAPWKM